MVHAAGLGRLTINSALGQPLKAEIDLVAVKKEEKPSLMARLASQDAFRQANVDYVPLLSTFKTSIENRTDGQAYVKVTSLQPLTEPFLNILIELNWSSGRLLREYTVLLAPPEIAAHPPAPPISQSSQSAAPGSANSAKAEPAVVEKPGSAIKSLVTGPLIGAVPIPESVAISKAHTVYGPVKRGDTLAGIVRNISLPSGVSVNQMLVALHRANRHAFVGDNIHRLKAGPILRAPDDSEIGTITPAEADKEVKMQTVEWNRYKLADVADLIPVSEELKQTVTGKIDRNVEADAVAAQEPPSEVLKLSKGEARWSTDKNADGKDIGEKNEGAKDSGGMEVSGVQDQLRAMEEDAIAKNLSRSEANARVALLEKNIKELQRLVELKNPALANMQQQVEALEPAGASATPPDPLVAILPQGGLTPELILTTQAAPLRAESDNVEEAMMMQPATVESATEIAKPMHVAEKSGREADSPRRRLVKSSLIDDLTANIEYLGGALVLLITGIVGISMVGRPKESSPDSSNVDVISSVFDPQLHDKAEPVATSVITATGIPPGTDTATRADDADLAAKAGAYLLADDVQTPKIPSDTSGGDHDSYPTPENPQTFGAPGTAVNLNSSSEPISPVLASPVSSAARSAELGLADISFNLDGAQPAKSKEFAERNTHWHEIVTRLDLARAYQEMGDKDAARQVLQEAIREGDVQQQQSARLLLANL